MSDMSGAGGDQWPDSHLRDTPRWALPFTPVGAGLVTAALAKGLLVDTPEAMERLIRRGYEPGTGDTQAVEDAFVASGVAAGGSFAGVRPKGSLGTFIGRRGSANLERGGRPAAARAIELAERMEAEGAKQSEIRKAAHRLLETDLDLGGIHKGADGLWRVEVRDDLAAFNEKGPKRSTLGRDLDHPTLYEAYPDLADIRVRRSDKIEGAEFRPYKSPQEIGLGWANDKKSVLHEAQHAMSDREGFAMGSNPDEELAMLQRDAKRAPRLREQAQQELDRARTELAWRRQNAPGYAGSEAERRLMDFIESVEGETWGQAALDRYGRSAGENEAYNVETRMNMTPAERRKISPLRTQDLPNYMQIVRQRD